MSALPALRQPVLHGPPAKVMLADIAAVVSHYFGVPVVDIRSRRRTIEVVPPRHAAWFLATTRFEFSMPEVGRWFGGRDHTTVIYGRDKIRAKIAVDPGVGELMSQFEIAAIAHARLRQRGLVKRAVDIDAGAVARRIVEGGQRAALGATIDEITAMAEALSRLEDQPEGENCNGVEA